MNIAETYSHLNGLEFLLVHKPILWQEIQTVIASVDANRCRTKISKVKMKKGDILFSPVDMNAAFKRLLREKNWNESRVSYWVTRSVTQTPNPCEQVVCGLNQTKSGEAVLCQHKFKTEIAYCS